MTISCEILNHYHFLSLCNLCNLEISILIYIGVNQKKERDRQDFNQLIDNDNHNDISDKQVINQRQNSYSHEDLKNILKDYKVNDNFTHPDFSVKEVKKYIKQSKKKSISQQDYRIQWDYDTYKWKWMKEPSTLEFFM